MRELIGRVREMMDEHWREPGYTCPNPERYPWQWLWDSCFHSLIWAELGDERAVVELGTVFAGQDAASGFVPHMAYWGDVDHHADFWGRSGFSSITQPPMYGHTVAELTRRGVAVPAELVERATRGLGFLLSTRRRSAGGLVELAHPWESGADDSPRWDDLSGGLFELDAWRRRKGEIVASIDRDAEGAPIGNRDAPVASAAFSALVAFNALELAGVTGDADLRRQGDELAACLAARWDPDRGTWADDGPTSDGSGRARTLEGLLGLLVDDDPDHVDRVAGELVDPAAHGASFGPTGVHRGEPTYAPLVYWRGPSWPQLTYLLAVAATRRGRDELAATLTHALIAGAATSGLAEYWHPDTGDGLGAVPQSWTGLAIVLGGQPLAGDALRDGALRGDALRDGA